MTCIIASVLIFAGYFGLARVVESHSQNHDKISINLLAFLAFLAGQGSQWTYTSALNTNCANFSSKDRGKVFLSYIVLCYTQKQKTKTHFVMNISFPWHYFFFLDW